MMRWLKLDEDRDPAAPSLISAAADTAACLLVETYYFDLDHRSEVELVVATQFQPVEVTVDRVHFFSTPYSDGDTIEAYVDAAERDAHERPRNGPPAYLGYSILRPSRDARIGRSLISPWATVPFRPPQDENDADLPHTFGYSVGESIPAEVIFEQVRTAVPESVNIYGRDFRAVGVPFMEQDGNILRCAHVSAWICHYSAVLRGMIPRRTTGQLHRAGHTTTSIARAYPSMGLSTSELSAILRDVQLAPEIVTKEELLTERLEASWADRAALFRENDQLTEASVQDGEAGLRAAEDKSRLWIRENLTATVCRYLNSGLPIILARNIHNHTQVIVGYLRESDLRKKDPDIGREHHSDVVAFLVSDDQAGPFELVYVEEIVDQLIAQDLSNELFIPLPDALWVSGDMAERIGTALFPRIADRRVELLNGDTAEGGEAGDRLREFTDSMAADKDRYAVRTYVTAGVDFKRSAVSRMSDDPDLVNAIRKAQLPRFIWVCEAIDRVLRGDNKPSVVATMVLDATQLIHSATGKTPDEDVDPLFVHLPTLFFSPSYRAQIMGAWADYSVTQQTVDIADESDLAEVDSIDYEEDDTGIELAEYFWHHTQLDAYHSGRWGSHLLAELPDATSAKGAIRPN